MSISALTKLYISLPIVALMAFSTVLLSPSISYAGWVKGYTKADGTYVNGYWKSDPNGLKYDNYSFDGDWSDAYNDSYYSSTRNYSSDWYTPSWVTQDDYYVGKSFYDSRSSYSTYSYDLYDYDYNYWDDPVYNYTPSYDYGYNYFDSLSSYKSSYYDYDTDDYSSSYSSPYSSSLYNSYTSPYSSAYDSYSSPYSSTYNSYSSPYSSTYNAYSSPYNSYSSPYSSTYDSYSSPYSSSY